MSKTKCMNFPTGHQDNVSLLILVIRSWDMDYVQETCWSAQNQQQYPPHVYSDFCGTLIFSISYNKTCLWIIQLMQLNMWGRIPSVNVASNRKNWWMKHQNFGLWIQKLIKSSSTKKLNFPKNCVFFYTKSLLTSLSWTPCFPHFSFWKRFFVKNDFPCDWIYSDDYEEGFTSWQAGHLKFSS